MKQVHRGEIVRSRVDQSKKSITALAKEIGYERAYMYTLFGNENLSYDLILKIGRAIHWDFTKDFPDIVPTPVPTVAEAPERYGTGDPASELEKCKEDVVMWRERYYTLMEDHNKLLRMSLTIKGKK